MKRINKNIRIFSWGLVCALIIAACAESYQGLDKIQTDGIAPGKITVNEVVPKSGALEIHFSLPKGDDDIAQVVASYLNDRQEKVDFTVSRYTSSITAEGFTGTDEREVELVCVDNSGNESEVTVAKGSPLISPVELARETMTAEAAFGGVKIDWENVSGDLLVIHVLTDDTLQVKGDTKFSEDPTKRIYTRDTTANRTYAYVRQYPDYEQRFGFVISDKWGNRSDTLVGLWTPFREDVVDYKQIEALSWFDYQYTTGVTQDYDIEGIDPVTGIQKDGLYYGSSYGPHTLFNGSTANAFWVAKFTKNLNDGDQSTNEFAQSVFATYDLNIDVSLSRMKIHWRQPYIGASVKRFRFWGTNDANADRQTKFPEGWTLVGEYVAPDAVDSNNPTPDELEAAKGMEFSIQDDNVNPEADPSANFRYLRIEMLESYAGPDQMVYHWNEIFLWGQIEKKYYE